MINNRDLLNETFKTLNKHLRLVSMRWNISNSLVTVRLEMLIIDILNRI